MSMEIADYDGTALNNVIGTKFQGAANRGLAAPAVVNPPKSGCAIRSPNPLPPGYLLHYPINILIHIFWLASHRDRSTLLALSRASKFFHEICKPLVPPALTLSRTTYIANLMELRHESTGTRAERDLQLVNLPDMGRIRNLRNEYPSKPAIHDERSLYARPYLSSRPHIEREVCDRETQVESGDSEAPSWAGTLRCIIRRPQPPPPGYLLNYPIDLLTRIFELACVDDPAAGRSLCLASKGFYAVVKPVMLYRVELRKPSQILRLARLVSVDATARAGIRHLTIDIPELGEALLREELDWAEKDEIGGFHWDSGYWGDPDAKYMDDSKGPEELGSLDKPENRDESKSLGESERSDESEDSSDSGEEMDIKQDMDFLASSEGQLFGNLVYGPDGELTEGGRWPWDVGLEKAKALVENATSDILHAVAPILRNLELISMEPRLNTTLPIFPGLSKLMIHVTQFHFLSARPHVLFPALKYLYIQGRPGGNRTDLGNLIHHAPSVIDAQVPFDRDFCRALLDRYYLPSLCLDQGTWYNV